MSARRVLVVASHFPPAGGGGIQRTVALVRRLCEQGWDVRVLTRPADRQFLPEDGYFASRVPAGIEVRSARPWRWNLPLRLLGRAGLPSLEAAATRFFSVPDDHIGWIPPAAREGTALLRERAADAIYATAPKHAGHWVGRILARRFSLPLVLDFRDDFVGNPMVPIPTPLHRRLMLRLERRLLSGADRAVFNTPAMEEDYHARYPDLASRFTNVPNGFEPADLGEALAPVARRAGPCRILASGSIYGARDLAPILRALAEALRAGTIPADGVRLDLCGVHWTNDLPLPAALAGLVRIHGFVPRDHLLRLYRDADLLLSCEDPVRTTAVPGKIYEHLALGRRILFVGAPRGAVTDLLREAGVGETVHPADAEGLRRSLAAAACEVLRGTPPERAPLAFLERYRRAALSERLEGILLEAIRGRAPVSAGPPTPPPGASSAPTLPIPA
ncbi:MAG: glycosyltransferase [Planctomycetes bacterium]|nr:glycosyltransferase [Planctomycetota bacterium]